MGVIVILFFLNLMTRVTTSLVCDIHLFGESGQTPKWCVLDAVGERFSVGKF